MRFVKTISHLLVLALLVASTNAPVFAKSWFRPLHLKQKEATLNIPTEYDSNQSGIPNTKVPDSAGSINWQSFFSDPYLLSLIETALENNQEFNIFLQEIEIARNEVQEKKGEYLPKVGLGMGAGHYKDSEHSRAGAVEKLIEKHELRNPHLDFNLSPQLTWEIDIWKKLRNAKNASQMRLISQYEGRNYLISKLVTEIARSYYELMTLDNSLNILDENIKLQDSAFLKMKELKEYAKSNQLAVNRFEAQLLKTKSQRFKIQQKIIETENRLKFLSGVYDNKPILRHSEQLISMPVDTLQIGVPAELLDNRPDIRQAEYALKAAKLDLKSVKANLYPSLSIKAGIGFSAFAPDLLFNAKSLAYDVMGDLIAPLINRKALIARIQIADAYQTQTVLNYEQTLLQAYTEVLNQMSRIQNLQQSFETKQREVLLLDESIEISNNLFQYAKADYVEVLLTQEEKLNAQQELLEIKKDLISSRVDLYRALGGGWQ